MGTEIFASRLKETREASGKTHTDFAKMLGITRPTLRFYERGERTPDIETLVALHNATGISVEYFLGLSDSKGVDQSAASRVTGLSAASVEKLKADEVARTVTDFLLQSPHIDDVVKLIVMLREVSFDALEDSGKSFTYRYAEESITRDIGTLIALAVKVKTKDEKPFTARQTVNYSRVNASANDMAVLSAIASNPDFLKSHPALEAALKAVSPKEDENGNSKKDE